MTKLKNYVQGQWVEGTGKGTALYHAVTGEEIFTAGTGGVDMKGALHYARTVGGPALRKMTFHERARMLKALALHLNEKKKDFARGTFSSENRLSLIEEVARPKWKDSPAPKIQTIAAWPEWRTFSTFSPETATTS